MKKSATSFFEDVYEVARLIPEGRVTSYGAIARFLGTRSSARMVGWALNGCPPDVPAHRIVNRQGLLTASHQFPASDSMESRLKREGIEVLNNQIRQFSEIFWDPNEELPFK